MKENKNPTPEEFVRNYLEHEKLACNYIRRENRNMVVEFIVANCLITIGIIALMSIASPSILARMGLIHCASWDSAEQNICEPAHR